MKSQFPRLEWPTTAHMINVYYQGATNHTSARMVIKSLITGETIKVETNDFFADTSTQAHDWLVRHCYPVHHYGEGGKKGWIFSVANFTSLKKSKAMGEFFDAYIEAMIWADGETEELEGAPMSEELIVRASKDCAKFYHENARYFGEHIAQAGHDFWLTRNHHGSGFWDRPEMYGEHTNRLTDNAHKFAELDVIISDRGELDTF